MFMTKEVLTSPDILFAILIIKKIIGCQKIYESRVINAKNAHLKLISAFAKEGKELTL